MPGLEAIDPLLQKVPLRVLGLLLVVACLVAVESGIWWARDQLLEASADHKPVSTQALGMILGSVFRLLALLISLSFSLALDRYEERRVLVASEASAIRAT